MPPYITLSNTSSVSSSGVIIPTGSTTVVDGSPVYTSVNVSNVSNQSQCCDGMDGNAAIFFNNLATKLLEMSTALEKKIEDLMNKTCLPPTYNSFYLVEIDTPSLALGVRQEYLEYVKRYGPPCDGIFEEDKLNILRKELNIEIME
jgi:hypothetical protein